MVEDAQEVKEILEVVSKEIPKLIEGLTEILYGEESSAKYGKAIASFYKSLIDSGMTNEQAFELTQQYMSSLNLAGMIGDAIGGHKKGDRKSIEIITGDVGHMDKDFGKEIEERVKEKIRKDLGEDKE
ncbi:MAG: hypothetical protein KAW09_00645 [Thermoplasmata archaeon]|nr:hypothetical protein [Thermoplasmata archaeon]